MLVETKFQSAGTSKKNAGFRRSRDRLSNGQVFQCARCSREATCEALTAALLYDLPVRGYCQDFKRKR